MELKEKGWKNPAGDQHFEKQRQRADFAEDNLKRIFFNMMMQIGDELHATTDAFSPLSAVGNGNGEDGSSMNVLDICMAPGGFAAAILKYHPSARISGLSLRIADGGHKMLVNHGIRDPRVQIQYLDITMLTTDLYPTLTPSLACTSDPKAPPAKIPHTHPSSDRFLPSTRPFLTNPPSIDLAVCDGQVLRAYRPNATSPGSHEPTRLNCAQLIIALTRLRPGGKLVILLHKIDAWNVSRFIQTVESFTTEPVRLFKSTRKHTLRSSFYLVARGVQPDNPAAKRAVEGWRRKWLAATLAAGVGNYGGGDQEDAGQQQAEEWQGWAGEEDVHEFIKSFGQRLIELGTPIWKIQARALEKASFTQ